MLFVHRHSIEGTDDDDKNSYTPPESYTVSTSSPSQIDTPQATPTSSLPTSSLPPSPKPSRLAPDQLTPLTPYDSFLPPALGDVCVTPRPTPPLSLQGESISTGMPEMDFEPVITPQV